MAKKQGLSLQEVVAKAQPRTATVRLCLRGDLIREHERLEKELTEARRFDEMNNEPDTARAIAEAVQGVEADMRDSETEFVLTAMGRRTWSDLIAEFPPTEEHKKQGMDYHTDDFPPVAIATSLVEPSGVTRDNVDELLEVLNLGQFMRLWAGCLSANLGDKAPGESVAASVVLQRSRPNSSTADPVESLEVSS